MATEYDVFLSHAWADGERLRSTQRQSLGAVTNF